MQADIHTMEHDGAPPQFYVPQDYRFIPAHPVDAVTPAVYKTTVEPDGTASVVDPPLSGSRIIVDVPDSPFVEIRSGGSRAGATKEGLLVVDVDNNSSCVVIGRAVAAAGESRVLAHRAWPGAGRVTCDRSTRS